MAAWPWVFVSIVAQACYTTGVDTAVATAACNVAWHPSTRAWLTLASDSARARYLPLLTLCTCCLAAVAAASASPARRFWTRAAVDLAASVCIATSTVWAVKQMHLRQRPLQQDWESFPSGHASSGAVLAAWLAWYMHAGIAAPIWLFGVAASRVLLCHHFVSDVLAGGFIGSFIAVSVMQTSYADCFVDLVTSAIP